MANEVDELMNLDPVDLTVEDVDRLIAHYRKNRGLIESGVKPKKEEGPKISILDKLNIPKPKRGPSIERRD